MATKRKKVFALALALSMALSLMSVTAFADEEGTGGTITVKAGESTALTGYAISSGSTVLENERWVSGDLDIATVQVENGTVTVTGRSVIIGLGKIQSYQWFGSDKQGVLILKIMGD